VANRLLLYGVFGWRLRRAALLQQLICNLPARGRRIPVRSVAEKQRDDLSCTAATALCTPLQKDKCVLVTRCYRLLHFIARVVRALRTLKRKPLRRGAVLVVNTSTTEPSTGTWVIHQTTLC
jgi:hypothetical protein